MIVQQHSLQQPVRIKRERAEGLTLWRSFVLAMGYLALAILTFEHHRLEGVVCWHHAQWSDE